MQANSLKGISCLIPNSLFFSSISFNSAFTDARTLIVNSALKCILWASLFPALFKFSEIFFSLTENTLHVFSVIIRRSKRTSSIFCILKLVCKDLSIELKYCSLTTLSGHEYTCCTYIICAP